MGVYCCKNINEVIDTCNRLRPGEYDNMSNVIERNYVIALKYSNFGESLKTKIVELLKEFKL
jgi:hypothetical protein